MIKLLPWLAVIIISTGYLAQIWKIHEHREVRDLSIWSYLSWGAAYLILAYQGYAIDAPVFIFKNVATFGLVLIILAQIYIHRDDEWHDDDDKACSCGNELEPHWKHCPDCGQRTAVS
jgi:predicted membrane channel-forming protein YqfA (hemolysin III family)